MQDMLKHWIIYSYPGKSRINYSSSFLVFIFLLKVLLVVLLACEGRFFIDLDIVGMHKPVLVSAHFFMSIHPRQESVEGQPGVSLT